MARKDERIGDRCGLLNASATGGLDPVLRVLDLCGQRLGGVGPLDTMYSAIPGTSPLDERRDLVTVPHRFVVVKRRVFSRCNCQ